MSIDDLERAWLYGFLENEEEEEGLNVQQIRTQTELRIAVSRSF